MTGAYHTKDGGKSYNQINHFNGSHSFAYDPLDSTIMYIGSKSLNKSSNGGKTWERIFPFKDDILKEIFLGDHVDYNFVTTENSLYSNTRNQKETKLILSKNSRVENIKVDPNNSQIIYFSIDNFFFILQMEALHGLK